VLRSDQQPCYSASAVPDKTPCPRCNTVGFVRFETVIARGKAARHHYCGHCNRSWTITEDGQRVDHPQQKDLPDRSRIDIE
jgi:hypothetical protein